MKRPAEASLGIHAAYRAATAGFARYWIAELPGAGITADVLRTRSAAHFTGRRALSVLPPLTVH
jgi:hypothetical protein